MRILQINNFHYPKGGSDRYFLDIVELLKEEGHRVNTFSTQHERNINQEWMATAGVARIDTSRRPSITKPVRFFYSWENKSAIRKAIETFKPDIAHLHIYYGQLTSSILSPLVSAGVPIIQTLHEYKTVCPTQGLYSNGKDCEACNGSQYWRAITKRCNRGSLSRSVLSTAEAYISDLVGAKKYIDHYIAVSNYQKERLVKLGLPARKVSVIHHFARNNRSTKIYDRNYFLFVGRIAEGKGIECLFHALSKLMPNTPITHIVGEGILRGKLMKLAEELGLSDKIIWRGFLDGDDLINEYANSIAVINPSELNETFGLTVLEGIAAGRPVIAAKSGALPEIIRDGVEGLLFSPGDSDALAKCIKQFVHDVHFRESLAAAGLERAGIEFGRANHVRQLVELYERTASGL